MFNWLASLACVLIVFVATAQEETKDVLPFEQQQQVLWIGTSNNSVRQLDLGVSPLTYAGPGIGTTFGYRSENTNRLLEIMGSLSYNAIQVQTDYGNFFTNNILGHGRADLLFKLNPMKEYRVMVGPYLSSVGHANFNSSFMNAALFYDLLSSSGASVRVKRTWQLNQGEKRLIGKKKRMFDRYWTAEAQISIPFLHFGLRPPFAVLHHTTSMDFESIDFNNFLYGPFGSVLQLETMLGLTYHVNGWNAWQFRYHYNAYRIDQGYNYFESFNRRFEISYVFNLTRSLNE